MRIHHCASLVNPDSTILTPKDGLRRRKRLVKLTQSLEIRPVHIKKKLL